MEQTRKNNLGSNLFQILSKYNKAGSFLRSITDIVRKVNSNSDAPSVGRFDARQPQNIIEEEPESPRTKENRDMRFVKQGRVNSINPSKAGVISSPDPRQQSEIQKMPSSSKGSNNLRNQARNVIDEDEHDINNLT